MRYRGTEPTATSERLLLSSLRLASAIVFLCAALTLLVHETPLVLDLFTGLARFLASRQDIPVALGMILFFVLYARRDRLVAASQPALRSWQVIALVLGIALAAWGLRVFVLFDFDLSRDEQMVAFDSAIYRHGLLFARFPPEWRDWYVAFNTTFILPIGDREGWVSSYLPGNAGLRALLGRAIPDALVSPFLLLVAGLALWRIAQRLWPDSRGTQAAVLLLFAGSSQVILMAATRYAMTAHLAANLVWLWLFLQRRPIAHAGAIALGFFATGLHQPLFHPLFVLPFLDLLRRERNWRLLAVYGLCYGMIGLFWLGWPGWVSGHGLYPVPPEFRPEGVSYLDRLRTSATAMSPVSLGLMGVNLLRFAAWQHLLLVPLLIVGLRVTFRTEPLCRALALGMALLVLAMLVLLPAQAHGWGYRYLHGFIGSAVLIGGFGWHWLERHDFAPTRALRQATALTLLVLLPVHVWMARAIVEPYATASAALARTPSDFVVVDDWSTPFAPDLVRNRPDLSNRPLMLQASLLAPATLARLCAGGRTIAFADAPGFVGINRLFDNPVPRHAGPFQTRLQQAAPRTGCRVASSAQTPARAVAIADQE